MNESTGKIIVFDSYENTIKANLVKTKLDAYGIPCFLSGENFVNLYPFKNELFSGASLHVFENDVVRIKEILEEEADGD